MPKPKAIHPASGAKFGRWTVTGEPVKYKVHWHIPCTCECGVQKEVHWGNLRAGKTTSCGCLHHEQWIQQRRKHGEHGTPLYRVWRGMIVRCTDPNYAEFHHYGGRGITICDEWMEFIPFRDWAKSHGYEKNLTIDRWDNEMGYFPENCRWVTPKENSRNKRSNRLLTIFGETKCITEWADDPRCKVNAKTLGARINSGWAVEKAILEPPMSSRWNKR